MPPSAAADPARTRPGRSPRRSSRPFARFLAQRLGALVLLAIGITFVAFVLTQLVPGDPAAANLGQQAINDPAAVAAFRAALRPRQAAARAVRALPRHLLHGDLGQSEQNHDAVHARPRPVRPGHGRARDLLDADRGASSGIGLGVLAAMRRNKLTDQVLRVVSLGGISMPTFWLGADRVLHLLLPAQLAARDRAARPGRRPPPPSHTGIYTVDALLAGQWSTFVDALRHLVLPGLVLAAYNIGLLTRYTRSAVLEVINDDYVRAARSKGLPERIVDPAPRPARGAARRSSRSSGSRSRNVMTGTVLVENDLLVAGHRPVRLPQRDDARPAGDHGREPVRRDRLHHDQLRRRRAVRRRSTRGMRIT